MRRITCLLSAAVVATTFGLTTSAVRADEPLTPRSAVPKHDALKKTATIPNFRIGGTYDLDNPEAWEQGGVGGTTLEELGAEPLRIGYITVGTPETNENGEIVNAVLINSYYSGDATNMYEFWYDGQEGNEFSGGALVGPGRTIDTDKHFVVIVDALGLWGASKPSDGLGMNFPQYSYMDMVQASYRLLRDELNVAELDLVTGVSMGATQTYVWGVMHPDFAKAILPVGGTTQSDGGDPVGKWTFQLATSAIKSDPVWQETGGDYYDLPKEQHPNNGVAFLWSILSLTGYDFDFRTTQPWETVEKDVFYWDRPNDNASSGNFARAQVFDAVDLLYRNEAGNLHNINDELDRVRSRALVMHVKNDQWLNFQLAEKAAERIPGADLIGVADSPISHYAVFSALNTERENPILTGFLADVADLAPAPAFEAANFQHPGVASEIDPEESFWKDHVTYPFPVKFAQASTAEGDVYEIGYMDEVAEGVENPETLVIIHGKGAFGALYGKVIRHAVESGLRVVVPDLPGYGMSGPGNLDKSPARSMQELREVVHDLVVNQLGVEHAYYMGHSLGGHHVLGYALTWPDAVKGLILEAPAGLEEYPMAIDLGDGPVPLFDPALSSDWEGWLKIWGPTGILDAEMNRTAESVEDFYFFRTRDAAGNQIDAETGYFLRDGQYARLHADQRIGMIDGNPAELEQWVNAFIFDIHTMASEMLEDDPDSLYKRSTQLEMPIFLAFGAKEPFIPGAAFNGLTDLAGDIITPFMLRMREAGNPPQLKIYPDAAHFIHSDEPVAFPRDVVDFVLTGTVDSFSPPLADRIINGAPTVGVAAEVDADAGSPTAGLNK